METAVHVSLREPADVQQVGQGQGVTPVSFSQILIVRDMKTRIVIMWDFFEIQLK